MSSFELVTGQLSIGQLYWCHEFLLIYPTIDVDYDTPEFVGSCLADDVAYFVAEAWTKRLGTKVHICPPIPTKGIFMVIEHATVGTQPFMKILHGENLGWVTWKRDLDIRMYKVEK